MALALKREQLFQHLVSQIQALPEPFVRRVAIDGVDGAGKTTFADQLAEVLRASGLVVIRASVDGFHQPRVQRYAQGKSSPQGFFEDSYNYPLLNHCLLEPLSPGGSGLYCTQTFDQRLDQVVDSPWQKAEPGCVLVFDGIFLQRPELRLYWDYSIFLKVNFAVSVARCAARDGSSADPLAPENQRYVQGQRLYLERCQPEQQASVVIDYNDLEQPEILRSV